MNRTRRWSWVASLVGFVMALVSPMVGRSQERLAWDLQAGDEYRITTRQEMTTSYSLLTSEAEPAPQAHASSAAVTLYLHWHVRSRDGQVAHIAQRLERLAMNLTSPAGDKIEYDSARKDLSGEGPTAALAQQVQPFLGRTVELDVLPTGAVTLIAGTPAAGAEKPAVEESGRQPNANREAPPHPTPVQQIFSPEGIKNMFVQCGCVLPDRPVVINDHWSGQAATRSQIGTMVMDMDFVYLAKKTQGDNALSSIGCTTKVSILPRKGTPAALGMTVENQQNEGTILFDRGNSRFVNADLRSTIFLTTQFATQKYRQTITMRTRTSFAPQ